MTIYSWFVEFKYGRINLSNEFRRPSTAVNNKNIAAVHHFIETDKHVTFNKIQASSICTSQVQSIPHNHLAVRKLCSRWISYNLTDAQKSKRVTCFNPMLTRFTEGTSNLAWSIVTYEETWIHNYHPETKQKLTIGFQDESNPTKIKRV